MNWYGWWLGAIFSIAISMIIMIICAYGCRKVRFPKPNHILIISTGTATSILLYPLHLDSFSGVLSFEEYFKTGIISIQHAIHFFAFDGYSDALGLIKSVESIDPYTQDLYIVLMTVLCLVMPALSIGVVLSLFRNVTSYFRYIFSFSAETHVFSELNEKTLTLAKSIDEHFNKKTVGKKRKYRFIKKALIVFTDINTTNGKIQLDLIEQAKEINAILFTKPIRSIKYRNQSLSVRKVKFYLISDDEENKIQQAETIMDHYDVSDQIELYLFSDSTRSALLIAAKNVQKMKVVRVNDIQTLIYHNLDAYGMRLFRNARDLGSSEKLISVIIIGLGKYGMETLKALTWFCQMTGYRLKINAFDIDENAETNFIAACPELQSRNLNGQNIPGEARYDIKIHAAVNIHGSELVKTLYQINDATYIFIDLGNDELNLSTASNIRMHTERIHYTGDHHKPDIETVIYNSHLHEMISEKWNSDTDGQESIRDKGVSNFKGQPYRIHTFGDLNHFYCVDTLLYSKLEKAALETHCLHYPKEEFWRYEYNYRSSLARVLHEKMRQTLGLDSPELEHMRWNAYMRSEGYQYSGNPYKTTRNDLGKLHNDLIPFNMLDEQEREKDKSLK